MPDPPTTERRPSTRTRHGEEIEDPYAWLGESDAVADWTDAQNEYTDAALDGETRDRLRERFEPLAEMADCRVVRPAGDWYFQRVKAPEADHHRLTVRAELDDEARTLADPNEGDGTQSLDWYVPAPDGEHVAYGVAEGGTEQYDVVVLSTADGEELFRVEDVGRASEASLAWDGAGFYYVATGSAGDGGQFEREIRYRALDGEDEWLLDHDDPHTWPGLHGDPATGRLVVSLTELGAGTDLLAYDGEGTGDDAFAPLVTGIEAELDPELADGRLYLRTEHDAPRGRLLAADIETLDPETFALADAEAVVPEGDGVLLDFGVGGDALVCHHLVDATARLTVYDADGTERGPVDLPAFSAVDTDDGLRVADNGTEAFYRIEGFDRPPAVERTDLRYRDRIEVNAPEIAPDVDLTVTREWVESTGGAAVPVLLVHRTGLDRDGENPTVLYAYGGFRIPLTPSFGRFRLPFLADGGVFAVACARGGREFGEAWHREGMRERKQHTFDDVIAAAEGLIEREYTSPERLGLFGGSNGGLTVTAVLTQRPDLLGAALAAVPLTDMLSFHEHLLGETWTTEYGSPEDPEAFDYLREYSPYHNITDEGYPPVLCRTAAGDTRVHPVHARKFVARLQAEAAGGPFLFRSHEETGHGVGKPQSLEVAENLDTWTFFEKALSGDGFD